MSTNTPIPYHHWVAWSQEDRCFIGYCPDLFFGGICHGDDEAQVYARVIEFVREEMVDLLSSQKPLPPVTVRPMRELIPA